MRILICVLLGLACGFDFVAKAAPADADASQTAGQAVRGQSHDGKHVLETGDQLSFQILEDKKMSGSLLVNASSEVHVPLLGNIEVAGKTCSELAAELKALFEKDYYKRATVVLSLDSVNKVEKVTRVLGRVQIWGEVHSQGPVDIIEGHPLTLTEALLRAGGPTDNADKKKVRIIRNDGHGSTRMMEVNVSEIMEKGKTEKNVVLEPDDYIIVLTRLIRL